VFSRCYNQRQHIMFDLTLHKVIETAGDDSSLVGISVSQYSTSRDTCEGKNTSLQSKWSFDSTIQSIYQLVSRKASSYTSSAFQCLVWRLHENVHFIRHLWVTPWPVSQNLREWGQKSDFFFLLCSVSHCIVHIISFWRSVQCF